MIKKSIILFFISCQVLAPSNWLWADDTDDIRNMIFSWRDARQMKQLEVYRSFYSPQFQSTAQDMLNWWANHEKPFKAPGDVSLNISEPEINFAEQRTTATFSENYEFHSQSTLGRKRLTLKKAGDTWQIISEEWEKAVSFISYMDDEDSAAEMVDKNVLQFIEFHYEEDSSEKIYIGMNRFYIPELIALEGSNPRIGIDIDNGFLKKGNETIAIDGYLVQQLKTYYLADTDVLRILLKLNPAEDFYINPAYDRAENRYYLEISHSAASSRKKKAIPLDLAKQIDKPPEQDSLESKPLISQTVQETKSIRSVSDEQISEGSPRIVIVSVDGGRVRKSPSLKARIVFFLLRNDAVSVLDSTEDWYYIQLKDNRKGWSHKSLFREP